MKGVHVICGVRNPDFENRKVGICYLTICMKCHAPEKICDKYAPSRGNSKTVSEKGISYKRLDGRWCLCVNNCEPIIVSQEDLMDTNNFLVTSVGSTSTSQQAKQQSEK